MAHKKRIEWSIARMRNCLEWFAKLDAVDRWYVLTRIAEKDAPASFRQVAREQISAGR